MTYPPRNGSRRSDDRILVAAEDAVQKVVTDSLRKVGKWVVAGGFLTLCLLIITPTVWATNTTRDIQQNAQAITEIRAVEREQLAAIKELTKANADLKEAIDSLRYVLRDRPLTVPVNPLHP